MEVKLNLAKLQSKFDAIRRNLKKRHPSFFDEYKYYQLEMYPDEVKTDEEYWDDFTFMAFKIELVKDPKSQIDYDTLDRILSLFAFHRS